jgi:O-antigen ligase
MTEHIPKKLLWAGVAVLPPLLALFAYTRPGYFTSQIYIGGVLLLEFLVFALWNYRKMFFPVVLLGFLFAGTGVPGGGIWIGLRWLFLAVGAWAGILLILRDRAHHFGLFHALAALAGLAALISAAESRVPTFAVLRAASVLLLFVYAATGARLAVNGREDRFFPALIMGIEIFVAAVAGMYAVGHEFMGNPNSLGAVMGVVGAPILLWGALLADKKSVQTRRVAIFAICIYLVFHSHARAGIAAAMGSSLLLCLGMRKYAFLIRGLAVLTTLLAATAIFQPQTFSEKVSSATSTLMFKGKDPSLGIFASRETPWQTAMDSIRSHFWFGTGFGTTDQGRDATEKYGQFSSTSTVTSENGSSYLAILAWVGILGVLPFLFLLFLLTSQVVRTVAWMFKTGTGAHPAIPLAMVVLAGLLHAGFEDWMFAPGYYLSVFFWSVAFILVDLAPSASILPSTLSWRISRAPQPLGMIPGR